MRIFKDQIKNYKSIAKKYNTVLSDKLSLQNVVMSAVKELLDKDTDLTTVKNYNYYKTYEVKEEENTEFEIDAELDKKFIFTDKELAGAGWIWTKDIKLDYEIWKKLNDKFNLRTLTTAQQDIVISNVVNTALYNATDLKWRLRKETIDAWDNSNNEEIDEYDEEVISWKKQIIDSGWTIDKLLVVLDKFKMINDSLAFGEDIVKINCPSCGHEDFAIFLNENGSVVVNCLGGKCNIGRGSIWQVFEDEGSIETVIDTIWDTLKNYTETDIDRIKNGDYVTRKCESYTNRYLTSIIDNCVEKYNYMYKKGFTKDVLIECDVLYRDNTINAWNNKVGANEINDFRYRICYVIKDLKGNIVGLQGRSIFDNNDDRKRFVENDEHFNKVYWENFDYNKDKYAKEKKDKKFKKLCQKVLSSAGFTKSQHLFLAYKYIGMKGIKKVVVTEGPKDAVKVYAQKLNDIAVVSSQGKDLSTAQVELLKEVFGNDVEIVMAYDGDEAGRKGNINAYNRLIKKGFWKVSFVDYKNWKDFGDIIAKTKTAENKIIAGMINNTLSFDKYNNKNGFNKVKTINKMDIKSDDVKEAQAEQVEEKDTIFNGQQLVVPEEEITFNTNGERTADWFATLIKLAKKEAGNFIIDIDDEIDSLQENGKDEWFKEFTRKYGDMTYNIILITSRFEARRKAREILARLKKQAISVTDEDFIPF